MNEKGRCLHASCGLLSVMFIKTATEREAIPDAHSSANKPRKPRLCNWCTNGSGWWGMALDWRGPDWDFKGLLDAYQQMRSHQTQEDGTDERSANAPPPPPPSSSVHSALSAADLRSQATTGGHIVSRQTDKNTQANTGGSMSSCQSVSKRAQHWIKEPSTKVKHTSSGPKLGLRNYLTS